MTILICPKCNETHEVDTSKTGWSVMCERCRQPWSTAQRAWMSEKHKEMVKKRTRAIKGAKRR